MAVKFHFCPRCAGPMGEALRFNALRPVCAACGFVQFHDPKVAVIALVVNHGRVLLAQRAVNPAKGKWSLPGGYMDADEMPQQALQRELREEVGLDVQITDLLDIYPMDNDDGEHIGIVLAYRAVPTGSPDIPFVADDVQAAGWYAPAEIPKDLAFDSTRNLLHRWMHNTNEPDGDP